jgi:diaminopimelate epimerase
VNSPVTVVPVLTGPRTLPARDAGTRSVPALGPSAVPSGDVGFDKYTLCGNTFLIVDETRTPLRDDVERSGFARWALDEHFGVGGANNVIYLTRLLSPGDAMHTFRIFEQDGSESLSCGNGLLCAAAVFGRGDLATGLGGPAREWQVLTELPTGRPQLVRVGVHADGGGTWVDVGPPRRMPTDLFRRPTVADNDVLDARTSMSSTVSTTSRSTSRSAAQMRAWSS